jgi:peptide/nickel transport system ATP-binding protein
MPPLLAVRDLVLHYQAEGRRVRALDGVSFEIAGRGEALGVVGESGSGKSSLANALMRLLPKNTAVFSGSIRLDGEELTSLSDEQFRQRVRWRRMAMVFQGAMNVLNPVLRVGDQIAEPMLLDGRMERDAASQRTAMLLDRVGLSPEHAARYPHELSGGQKQRVVIAAALALEPDLLILDEPTSALDVSVQAQIMDLLKDLKRDAGMSMLFITHDIGLASDLCDRIAVAYAGQHAEIGSAEQVLLAPEHPYTGLLLASLPRLHEKHAPSPMPGNPPDPANLPRGCRFHPRCPLRFDRCDEMPPPFPVGEGGHALCWLADPAVERNEVAPGIAAANALVLATGATATPPRRETGAPLVVLENVTVAYQSRSGLFRTTETRAVDGVSLEIARGETLALVGESGSGKTTVGRASLRLAETAGGRILFDGEEITGVPDERLGWLRRRAQIVFQDPFSSLNPSMRVGELVGEPLVIDGVGREERRERVLRALEAVELVPAARWAARYPTAMSGGQRQRVGIARALVRDPEYIVADEPVSMIDASSRIEILMLLRAIQRERGTAFLYITHDIASARHFADRIAVMDRGRVIESGEAGRVIDAPEHPVTRALIAAVPEPDPANRFRRRSRALAVPGAS